MMGTDSGRLGTAIKRRRLALGITQGELARRSGKDQTAISKIELGTTPSPSAEVVLRIARALETTVEQLFDATDQSAPSFSALPAHRPYRRLGDEDRADQRDLQSRTEDLYNTTRITKQALKIAKQLRDASKSGRDDEQHRRFIVQRNHSTDGLLFSRVIHGLQKTSAHRICC